MPRLPPPLLRLAHSVDPSLPLLLPVCRDLHSARNELRWLREHARANAITTKPAQWQHRFQTLVAERATGRPLQYVLGNQPFGDLEILCEPGVLIPRPETESLTSHLANLLSRFLHFPNEQKQKQKQRQLRILDLCTGTGCISLFLHSLLSRPLSNLHVLGIDKSPAAISLANKNKQHNIKLGHLKTQAAEEVHFQRDDIFAPQGQQPPRSGQATGPNWRWVDDEWDILISNPPYISPRSFNTTTSKSVRDWEPKSALVPSNTIFKPNGDDEDAVVGDTFYPRLLDIASRVSAKVVLFEVADLPQAMRVAGRVATGRGWDGYEIWRDWPGQVAAQGLGEGVISEKGVDVLGEGNGRAVLAWTEEGGRMLGK